MQRYEAYISSVCECGCGGSMDDNGDYVKYDDVIKLIKENEDLKSKIKRLEKDLDDWQEDCGV